MIYENVNQIPALGRPQCLGRWASASGPLRAQVQSQEIYAAPAVCLPSLENLLQHRLPGPRHSVGGSSRSHAALGVTHRTPLDNTPESIGPLAAASPCSQAAALHRAPCARTSPAARAAGGTGFHGLGLRPH